MDISEFTTSDAWNLIDAYMRRQQTKLNPLIAHQVTSYNLFLENGLDNVIQGSSPIVCEIDEHIDDEEEATNTRVELSFSRIRIRKPTITEKNGFVRQMYPNDARLRNETYAAKMETEVLVKTIVTQPDGGVYVYENQIPRVILGSVPIMLKSDSCPLATASPEKAREMGECAFEEGGYFIINGGERVIVSQEMITENWLYVFQGGRGSKYIYLGELKSAPSDKQGFVRGYCIKMMKTKAHGDVMRVNIPKVRMDIPLGVLFKAIGITTDEAIARRIINDFECENASVYWKLLVPTLREAEPYQTQEQALELLAKNTSLSPKIPIEDRIAFVKKVLIEDFLPHIGRKEEASHEKGWFMGYSARRIIRCMTGEVGYDDRDGYHNKRIELAGSLMTRLFYQYWTSKMLRDIRSGVQKELQSGAWKATRTYDDIINATNIFKVIRTTILDAGLKYALATGNFGMKNSVGKVGVSQVLARLNRNNMVSHLRRITTPVEKSGKLVAPRKLHSTSWGIVCPSETPEGESVGVVKNLSITTMVTNQTSPLMIYSLLREKVILMEMLKDEQSHLLVQQTRVWVNGRLYGLVTDGVGILRFLRSKRATGVINPMTTMYLKEKDLIVWTDGGRILRPLLRVARNGKLRITRDNMEQLKAGTLNWTKLVCSPGVVGKAGSETIDSMVEYVDVNEMNSSMILMGPKYQTPHIRYTHMEIHPCTALGTMASMIPFPDHNQAPRNTYQSAMGKQAMGVYSTSYLDRMDTASNVLCYPQKPLVYTQMDKYFRNTDLPNGLNAVVAIMCFTGYNQEDSVLLNKASVERGLFRSFFYRTYRDEEKKNATTGEEEKFCKPDVTKTEGMRHGTYDKLASDGFVPANTWVESNDIIIGKVSPVRHGKMGSKKSGGSSKMRDVFAEKVTYRDLSKTLRSNEDGYVDRVYRTINGDGYCVMKLRVRSERVPTIGDKFSSRHGQKGTCGMIVPEEDMPITPDGIRPDIIINPHAVPSRMTIAQVVECVLGKAGCMTGSFGNGTPFEEFDAHSIGDALELQGMERWGNEMLMSGITGEMLSCPIFIGPTFYQRLKHMVNDKIHSRSSGPVVMLTRQPAEGRSRDGGHRFGEMERDCMISHGTSVFLKERMMDVSDKFPMTVGKSTGRTAVTDPSKGIYRGLGGTGGIYTSDGIDDSDDNSGFAHLELPAAMKLLMQEIESIGITTRMLTA
jgi:DNA-directed RNA polymerase II subunit RPB2